MGVDLRGCELTWRSGVSLVVVLAQPAFLLMPAATLGALSLATMPLATVLVAVNVLGEGIGAAQAFRSRPRTLEELAGEAPDEPVLLIRAEHPRLWALIDSIAAEARIASPERVVLSLITPASVRLVGPQHDLLPGARVFGGGHRPDPTSAQSNAAGGGRTGHQEPPSDARSTGARANHEARNDHAATHVTPTRAGVRPRPTRPYELSLSPVLLAQLSTSELTAVAAHEIGHVATGAMRELDPAHLLVTNWAMPLYDSLPPGLMRMGGWLHQQLWIAVDAWANRPRERTADGIAFRLAGPRTTAAALARVEQLDLAQTLVLRNLLPAGIRAGLRPSIIEAVEGVAQAPIARLRDLMGIPERRAHEWVVASHPTIPERIAAAEWAAAEGVGGGADLRAEGRSARPAADLVSGGFARLVDLERDLYAHAHPLHDAPAAAWPVVLDLGWRLAVADRAQRLAEVITTPATDRGRRLPRRARAANSIDLPADQLTARQYLTAVERLGVGVTQHKRGLGAEGRLHSLTLVALRALDRAGLLRLAARDWSSRGVAQYRSGDDWLTLASAESVEATGPAWVDGAPARSVRDNGAPAAVDGDGAAPAAAGRVTDAPAPDPGCSAPPTLAESPLDRVLRDVADEHAPAQSLLDALAALGADLDAPIGLTAAERMARPGELLAGQAGVLVHIDAERIGERWCALVTSSGLWLVPEPPRGAGGSLEREQAQTELLERAAADFTFAYGPRPQTYPGSLWLPEWQVAAAHAAGPKERSADLLAIDGCTTTLQLPDHSPALGLGLLDALAGMIGSRLDIG